MSGFDRPCFQGVAYRARHSFRVAEIAHEAPLHRRTEKIGACVADPFANGEGAEEIDTLTIPEGCRRRVYQPKYKLGAQLVGSQSVKHPIVRAAHAHALFRAGRSVVASGVRPLGGLARRDGSHCWLLAAETQAERPEGRPLIAAEWNCSLRKP